MTAETFNRVVPVSAFLATLLAVLLVASRFFQPFGYAAVPFCLPGLFILGADETQERYGYWGEIILLWLLSLPCIVIYVSLLSRWWQSRRRSRSVSDDVA